MINWGEEGNPWHFKEEKSQFNKTVKYRCEQKVLNRIDGMITSHSDTRREIILSFDSNMQSHSFKAEVTESFASMNPANMMPALELIDKIDCIKCGAEVLIDPTNGNIDKVVNFDEIKKNWDEYKTKMFFTINSTLGMGTTESKQVENFTDIIDNQFKDESTFRKDLSGKLFFDVFFDKYLVKDGLDDCKYNQTFHSFLFDQTPIEMTITQELSTDKETGLQKISRYISAEDQRMKKLAIHHIMNIYKERYQPIAKYNFTQYNYEFYHDILLSDDGLPEEIEVNIIEEVQNNVEILVTYKIRRLK